MKKIIGSLTLVIVVTMISCSNKPAESTKEVIVVPAAPVIVEKEAPEKPTTVTLDKNGVKVSTKKVNVTVH